MRKLLLLAGIFSFLMCTVFSTNAFSQKKSTKKGEIIDWVKVRELLSYNPELFQEVCCDCGPKTINDLLVGTPAIDGIIKSSCKIASKDIQLTKEIEFVKVTIDTVGEFTTVNISDGKGKKITAANAIKQLLKLTKTITSLAAEAKGLMDKKGPAQKEIEDASFLKKASLGAGLAREIGRAHV